MPNRIDNDDVISVYPEAADGGDLSAYIEAAEMLVNARCVGLVVGGKSYSDAELVIIEKWLAAHFFACENPRLRQEIIGRSSETILTKNDLGLKLTHEGQQVMVLDYLGGLVGLGADRKKIKITWLGRDRLTRRRKPLGGSCLDPLGDYW